MVDAAQLIEVVFDEALFNNDETRPQRLHYLVGKELISEFDRVLPKNGAKDGLEVLDFRLNGWCAIKEFTEVGARNRSKHDCKSNLGLLTINKIRGNSDFVKKSFAGLLWFLLHVAIHIKDAFACVEVVLDKPTKECSEASEEWLPESILFMLLFTLA